MPKAPLQLHWILPLYEAQDDVIQKSYWMFRVRST